MSNTWTENNTEKLITLYGQYQCLWNPFHSEFNNKFSRYKAYKDIKKSMNISGLTMCDCIQRITNTKKEYCYELSKIAAAIFCQKLYTPKAKWFKRMHVLLFPSISISHYNNFRKDRIERKFHDSDSQDDCLHSSFEILADQQICPNDPEARESPDLELCFRLRNSIHSTSRLQDTCLCTKTVQTVDAATEIKIDTADCETQMDTLHERDVYVSEGKKDRLIDMDDISMEAKGKTKDNFDIFGKSVAFQLRTVDIQTAMELKREIQSLLTKARLKTLESKSTHRNETSICCCDCSSCKIMSKHEICSCGLTLKECVLLSEINESKDYCYK